MLNPANWYVYAIAFFTALILGLVFHFGMILLRSAGSQPDEAQSGFKPLSFGRDLYGAGLFFFFFAIMFIIAYGAHTASVLEKDASGALILSDVQDDFTFGMFVALKDVGPTIGIVLGFLSLAWARFFERSIGEGAEDKPPAPVKVEVHCCRCTPDGTG